MAVSRLPFAAVRPLVRRHFSLDEDPDTAQLIRRLTAARRRGYLLPRELDEICYWKSPRAIHHIRSNSPSAVRAVTRAALATRSERKRFDLLTSLNGVSAPMASSILTLLYPKRYGVIDIRVWDLLHKLGSVTKNARAAGFGFNNWYQYLSVIRSLARVFNCTARDVERSLFLVHKKYQKGSLYVGRT